MSIEARRAVSGTRPTVERSSAGWGSWPPDVPGDRPLSMTSRADRFEHAVMATELEQANRTGQHPVGLCGVVVDPAPLGATAQHVCRPCRELIGRRQELRAPQPTPWTLLLQWYEALVALLRRGVVPSGPKAIAPPRPVLALPPSPAAARPDVVGRPVPSPRPRTSPPLPAPNPAAGGRHRRAD